MERRIEYEAVRRTRHLYGVHLEGLYGENVEGLSWRHSEGLSERYLERVSAGVIIYASAASMLRGAKRHRGSSGRGPGAHPPKKFWSLSVQTTRRSNLALAGRRFNRILRTLITSLVV